MGKRLSAPLVPGGNNFTAMHLVFLPWAIRLKMSLWCYFFAFLIGIPGLCFPLSAWMLLHAVESGGKEDLLIVFFFFISGGLFLWLAVRMMLKFRKRCRSFFDLALRIFYPDGKKGKAISFSEFDSLQIICECCRGSKSSFDSFELNLVLKNGNRYNLLDHSNKECLIEEAEKLSEKLSLPLNDAEGERLNTDTFLNLPAGIVQNLLLGTLLLLAGIILFGAVSGQAYRMTKKSLFWKCTPALVEHVQIRKHSGKHIKYSLDLRYSYRVKGKKFQSSCYSFFSPRSSSRFSVEQTAHQYPVGNTISCYVDPDKPENAVISRHIPGIGEMFWDSPYSFMLAIIGILMLLNAARKKYFLQKRLRSRRSGDFPAAR